MLEIYKSPSMEIEIALLNILMTYPKKVDEVQHILHPDALECPIHREMYRLACEYRQKGTDLDAKAMAVVLDDRWFLNQIATKQEYIGWILSSLNLPGQAVSYAKLITQDAVKRQIRHVAGSLTMSEEEKAGEMAVLAREIGAGSVSNIVLLGDALEKANRATDDVYRAGGGFLGLSTGLPDLDNKLCGLEAGGLYVVAGRPAMGKSALGLTIALNAVMKGRPVQFFSLEMSAEQLAHRVYARFADVGIWNQRTGKGVDFGAMLRARQDLSDLPLFINDQSSMTAEEICHLAKDMARSNPPSLVVIDHLGIVAARDARVPRVLQIGEMTALFKGLAKQLKCPVMILHQLNRGSEQREDKRPGLADLRDSGSVEQDADAVILIHRDEYYLNNQVSPADAAGWAKMEEKKDRAKGKADLIIAKNRQGEAGVITVKFDGKKQVFESFAV